jgi:glyoxylase-like metal-dependent hydrolase (beta-lactamase superfamily II)
VHLEKHVADGIHRVDHALVNFYLVEDGSAVTVVDAGHPSSWGPLQEALSAIGRTPQDVEAVVLTHGHFDHVGFARRAREELGVPVLAPEGEEHLVRHPWDYAHERSRIVHALTHPQFVPRFLRMGAAGDLWVKGVDTTPYPHEGELDVPGRPAVVFTPGHTHAHCALHFPDRGAVIAGDAIVTFNVYTASKGPQLVSRAATADSARALESLGALEATGARTVLTGHGPAWTQGAAAAVELARAKGAS